MNNLQSITVTVDQRAAIRAGMVTDETITLLINLEEWSQEERNELAALYGGKDKCLDAGHYNDGYNCRDIACLPTPEGLLALIQGGIISRAKKVKEREKKKAASIKTAQEAARHSLVQPLEKWIEKSQYHGTYNAQYPVNEYQCGDITTYQLYPGMAEHYEDAKIEATRKNKERDAAAEARAVAEIIKDSAQKALRETQQKDNNILKEEGKKQLSIWAMSHGSDLLQARINGDYDWIELARHEFFRTHAPIEFCAIVGDIPSAIAKTNPTLDEMLAFNEAKELCRTQPSLYRNPQLLLNDAPSPDETDDDIYFDDDEDDDETDNQFCSIVMEIIYPDGNVQRAERRI